MIPIYKLSEMNSFVRERIMRRAENEIASAGAMAANIVADVKKNGDSALFAYEQKYAGVSLNPSTIRVSESEKREARAKINKKLLTAIERAAKNIRAFHEKQKPEEYSFEVEPGVTIRRRVVPLRVAGLYVPGGKAVYPSVMLMLGIPAKVAGCKRIVACTPCQKDGKIDAASIVAADICGVELYKCGGAQAVAAMAYGTKSIPRCDVIAGPGGPFVSAAQRAVKFDVKIEFPPGPSEGMVLADEDADPALVAADVLSEAEHGPESAGILVTNSEELANKVRDILAAEIEKLPEQRREYAKKNFEKYSALIVARSRDEAIAFANEYAPEHIVVNTADREGDAERIVNAGTVCVGAYSPITLGNFMAGPNAILPTGGFGRWCSGVSVDTFIKKPTVEYASKEGLRSMADDIIRLAEFEGFPAHAESIRIRFGMKKEKLETEEKKSVIEAKAAATKAAAPKPKKTSKKRK